jgi:hypothetical protein
MYAHTSLKTHPVYATLPAYLPPIPLRKRDRLPWVKFVLPTAPKVAVTMNGGVEMNSWVSRDELCARPGSLLGLPRADLGGECSQCVCTCCGFP